MKYLFTSIALLFIFSAAFAQTTTITQDTVIQESADRYKMITNHFFDNWVLGASAGAQLFYADHNKQMEFSDRITPAYQVTLGKWFSPGLGFRAGVSGLKLYGVTQNKSYSTGEVYDASQKLEKQEIEFYHIHGDMLFNLSNIFGSFRADRFYSISPYLGVGWIKTTAGPESREITANLGIYNAFRLGNAIDLTLDIRGAVASDRFDGEIGKRREEGVLSTTLGLAFKFNKQGWEKPTTTTISYDEVALNALADRLTMLEKDNESLRSQLANAKSSSVSDVKVENRLLAAPILVTFPINKSTVSNEARVNLGFFAKVIKEGSSSVVYNVTGYADKGTGTPAINERLSRNRAQVIYDVLTKEFGVSANQLQVAHEGGVENMYYNDPRLSRAVITLAK